MRVLLAVGFAFIMALLTVIAVALADIDNQTRLVTDRRYLDCVVISGDEMICKQVNATEPGYVPVPGHGGQGVSGGVTTHK